MRNAKTHAERKARPAGRVRQEQPAGRLAQSGGWTRKNERVRAARQGETGSALRSATKGENAERKETEELKECSCGGLIVAICGIEEANKMARRHITASNVFNSRDNYRSWKNSARFPLRHHTLASSNQNAEGFLRKAFVTTVGGQRMFHEH